MNRVQMRQNETKGTTVLSGFGPTILQYTEKILCHTTSYMYNQRQPTTADNSWLQQKTADNSRRKPTTANDSRQQPTTANNSWQQQKTADDSQRQPTSADHS